MAHVFSFSMSVGKRVLKGKRGTKYVNSDYLLRKIEKSFRTTR